jgi:hypothetical protein
MTGTEGRRDSKFQIPKLEIQGFKIQNNQTRRGDGIPDSKTKNSK